MNDIDEKRFKDALKRVAADPNLTLYEGLDTELPPASAFMNGVIEGGISETIREDQGGHSDNVIDADFEAAKDTTSVVPGEKRRSRRTLYSLASLAACVCIVFGVLFANGAGPFGAKSSSSGGAMSAADAAAPAPEAANTVSWETAGAEYKTLYSKIETYLGDMDYTVGVLDNGAGIAVDPGRDLAAPAAGAGAAEIPAPAPSAPAPVPAPSEAGPGGPGGEAGTAGSGYQDGTGSQSPTDNAEAEGPAAPAPDEPGAAPSYSDTNEQVAGVREADIVKTDGGYIYGINSNALFLVDTTGGTMRLAAKIPQPTVDDGQVYFEMYVVGDRLVAIRHGYNADALARAGSAVPGGENVPQDKNEKGTAGSNYYKNQTCIAYPIGGYYTDTTVDIYDIADKSAPALLHTLSQSGDYRDSRMIDGTLYLITNYYGGDLSRIDPKDPRTYVPLYAEDGEQLTPAPDDIILPFGDAWPAYTMVSGIDAAGSGSFVSNKSVYGESGTVYCSTDAVYFARANYSTEETPYGEFLKYTSKTETVLTKAALQNGSIEITASATVPGTTLNQFSLDEYGGVLRLVTTNDRSTWYGFQNPMRAYTANDWSRVPQGTSETSNALYTLDASLSVLGQVENLAPGERVFSCRFLGGIGYFVTFRQTDPLFSVDLSDPASPTVLGALNIPGFSEYLHPYADGELFGLGRDADAETGRQKGLKLTMFDNSDPADVKEKTTLLIEDGDAYSSAETNHKAILVDASKHLVAFPIQTWTGNASESHYLIYAYDAQTGFTKVSDIKIDTGTNGWAEIRGLFIGNTFYVVGPNQVGAYDMEAGFAEKDILQVDENANSVDRYGYYPPGLIVPLEMPVSVPMPE